MYNLRYIFPVLVAFGQLLASPLALGAEPNSLDLNLLPRVLQLDPDPGPAVVHPKPDVAERRAAPTKQKIKRRDAGPKCFLFCRGR